MSDDLVARIGRPRSEQARTAVLHAVDDLLREVGYAALTMKGIAERAGVGRQTVYRWWSTKAEVLFEASIIDAEQELTITPTGRPVDDLTRFLDAVVTFLTVSDAGLAYRSLLAAAQQDPAVAELVASHDVLADSARQVLKPIVAHSTKALNDASAFLVGPLFYRVMSGQPVNARGTRAHAELVVREFARR